MKRVLTMCLVLLLLTGCARTEPVPAEPEDPPVAEQGVIEPVEPAPEPEPVLDPEQIPDPEPAPEPAPEPVPAPEPIPEVTPPPVQPAEPEPKPEPEPEPAPGPDWAAYVAEFYTAITDHPEFNVLVWQENDTRTDLVIRNGVNDWNVEYVKGCLPSFEWTETSYEEFLAQAQIEGRGPELLFWDVEGGMGLSCFRDVDVVTFRDQTKMIWLRAVDPQGNGTLYDLLSLVAENAVSHEVRYVTVDGSLSPQEAAGRIAEKIAENYRSVPEWVEWKPVSVKAERAEVYDRYRGTPEEFCFNLGLAVKVVDPMAPEAGYWQAGSGLGEPDGDGFYGWGREVLVRKNDEGNWSVLDMGTGGYSVSPEWPAEKPWAAWLVELYCLTEGFTHDWLAPVQILMLPPEQMETLPAILDQLTEKESRELCAALGELLKREELEHYYTMDTLKPLLGDYGPWLDV